LEVLNIETNTVSSAGLLSIAEMLEQGFNVDDYDESKQCGLLELRIDHQKDQFSSQVERCLEMSIRVNTRLLKLGASIRTPGCKLKIDEFLMRNVDLVRIARAMAK